LVELDSEPRIALQQIALVRDAAAGCWNIRWRVVNSSGAALAITAVHLPHGQFKSAVHHFTPALEVAPGASERFQSIVQCHAPVGLVTENAFVILHCQWRGEAWRIFVRIRVDIKPAGEPHTATELITTQKVGFSGISN
jgi:hypothetical protein